MLSAMKGTREKKLAREIAEIFEIQQYVVHTRR